MGQVTFRDLCSSWGGGSKVKGGDNAGAAPVAKTLLSGSASGIQGREWAYGWDTSGTAARYVWCRRDILIMLAIKMGGVYWRWEGVGDVWMV